MNWDAVESLFAAAIDTPPADRPALIASSGADVAVRSEVQRLLDRHDALETPSSTVAAFLATLDLAQALELVDGPAATPARIGRYDIIRRLGAGASGVVYQARDSSLDRQVALKVLSAAASGDATALRRFAEEARVASALDHPRVVPVYDIGRTDDDRLFIAMAYLDGETLRERLARGPLPVAEAARIGREVAEGLAAAHAMSIVHRDVKPENIMLTGRGACIVDFGIAKIAGGTLTRTGAALGTAAYMSPEQTRGDSVDGRSDVWSLGVVLYELFTGARPFAGQNADAVVYGIRHDHPRPVHDIRREVPSALSDVVMRCLEKDPAKRVASADVLAAALADPPPRSPRWGRVVGVSLVLLTLLAGAGIIRARSGGASSAPPRTIVLMPFRDDSTAPEPTYLTPGLNEELDLALRRTPGIRLVGPQSTSRVLRDGGGLRTMDTLLGASALLRGRITHRGDSVIVRSELVATADSAILWSDMRQYPVTMVMHVPTDISAAVAVALGLGGRAPPRAREHDLVAYDLYLRGRSALNDRTPKGVEASMLYFREAIARDSGLALAYLGLAEAMTAANASGPLPARYARARSLHLQALAIDSSIASGHRLAGWIAMWDTHDWAAAGSHLRRALLLDSSDVWNYHYYAAWLSAVGRPQESMERTLQASALDPVSAASQAHLAISLNWLGRSDEAIAASERTLAIDSTWPRAWLVLGRSYLGAARYDDAVRALRRAGSSFAAFDARALLGYALARSGRTAEAREIAAEFEAKAKASSARSVDLFVLHLGLGDTAKALTWLERVPEDRGSMVFLLSENLFDPVRDKPEFRRAVDRMGLSGATRF